MIYTKTIKGWANDSSLLFSQNSKKSAFIKNLEKFKKDHNLKEITTGFYSAANSDKKRYIIKGWYWRGCWADPTKETYCYLIEK